jgi:RHS repeat-associated protein
MVASSIPCKLSVCADRGHACAGDSHKSSGIDVACPTTQNVLAIASPHELHWDSWPSSSTGTSSFCCNQQYSITAITTSTGSIAERYAYSAYGQPSILDASASVLSSSAINNRYTYTGREWDATLGLHHFRARWMSPSAGRFLGRDPIGYRAADPNLQRFVFNQPLVQVDPTGLKCTLWLIIAHGYEEVIRKGLEDPRFDPDFAECDLMAPICCWMDGAKKVCRDHYNKKNRKCKIPNNWPKGNHCIDTSTAEGFNEAKSIWTRYIPLAMAECCSKGKQEPCLCKECKVRYFCQDGMVGLPGAPLNPLVDLLGENPCGREYTWNCDTKSWNQTSTPWM